MDKHPPVGRGGSVDEFAGFVDGGFDGGGGGVGQGQAEVGDAGEVGGGGFSDGEDVGYTVVLEEGGVGCCGGGGEVEEGGEDACCWAFGAWVWGLGFLFGHFGGWVSVKLLVEMGRGLSCLMRVDLGWWLSV